MTGAELPDPRLELAANAIRRIAEAAASIPADELDAVESLLDEYDDVGGFAMPGASTGSFPAVSPLLLVMNARAAQTDLKTIMDGVKFINKQKDGGRSA
jgi:hypothetical protein